MLKLLLAIILIENYLSRPISAQLVFKATDAFLDMSKNSSKFDYSNLVNKKPLFFEFDNAKDSDSTDITESDIDEYGETVTVPVTSPYLGITTVDESFTSSNKSLAFDNNFLGEIESIILRAIYSMIGNDVIYIPHERKKFFETFKAEETSKAHQTKSVSTKTTAKLLQETLLNNSTLRTSELIESKQTPYRTLDTTSTTRDNLTTKTTPTDFFSKSVQKTVTTSKTQEIELKFTSFVSKENNKKNRKKPDDFEDYFGIFDSTPDDTDDVEQGGSKPLFFKNWKIFDKFFGKNKSKKVNLEKHFVLEDESEQKDTEPSLKDESFPASYNSDDKTDLQDSFFMMSNNQMKNSLPQRLSVMGAVILMISFIFLF